MEKMIACHSLRGENPEFARISAAMSSRYSLLIYSLAAGILLLAAWPLVDTLHRAHASWSVVAMMTLWLSYFGVALAVSLWPRVRVLKTVSWVLFVLSMVGFVAFYLGMIK